MVMQCCTLVGHVDLAQTVLDLMSDCVSGADPALYGDFSGWLPIHYAAHFGHTNVVNSLIQAGADVNSETKMGLNEETSFRHFKYTSPPPNPELVPFCFSNRAAQCSSCAHEQAINVSDEGGPSVPGRPVAEIRSRH